jgi:hypothetical protein
MHIVDGHIRDANMNYVCAAGTGSFIEEQANKLGYKVADVGAAVLGVKPPRATDRCTVFMEQDVVRFIEGGASREEALAAVLVAVAKNYLNKVVGNRHYSRKRIMFQGATARNKALVAAFEHVLDVEVVVSPYCHVMGAFGVARLVRQTMAEKGAAAFATGFARRIPSREGMGKGSHDEVEVPRPGSRAAQGDPAQGNLRPVPERLQHHLRRCRGRGRHVAVLGLHVWPRPGRAEGAQEPA